MYLKSIEIQGFKSFANKINFEFQDGITAIVGPNGSGKSNVADAVRWVLGEQSAKQLRSSKMEDVIFSGTETRKPMGYACVTITLDNSDHRLPIDYEEVVVARRVYRSGESEYLLNGSLCRLRDITDLFLDTGIGKEGYSIIGQGQIDKVLSSKPEDRRELFDEAAGIGKYKKRKTIAEKNLQEEKQNLVRISDILSEIEKQLGPLEKQSKSAKEYLKLYEELKRLEVNLFIIENDKIREQKEEVEKKIKGIEDSILEARSIYTKKKEEYNKLENLLETHNLEIDEEKTQVNENKIAIEKDEGEVKLKKEQISNLKVQIEEKRKRIKNIEYDIESKLKEKEQSLEDKKRIDEELELIDLEQIDFISNLEKVKNKILDQTNEVESFNKEIMNLLKESSNYKSNCQRYETLLEQNRKRESEIDSKKAFLHEEEIQVEKDIIHLKGRLKEILDEIEGYNSRINTIQSSIINTQKEIDKITKEINQYQLIFHSEKSRLSSLKNLTERYEGYGNSIRKIMDLKEKEKGILGVVADIIKVDKKYEVAIEIALGASIQNIVTDNEETAKKLINYLKKNKYGRATFLPLTSIQYKGNKGSSQLLKEKGVIGFADSLVKFDDKYSNLVGYLLGRNLLVDHIDNAILLSRKYKQSIRIVTLDGELLNPGGSMSGGAYKNSSNLLGRRREIIELEKTVKELSDKNQQLLEEKEKKKKSKDDLRSQLESIKTKVQGQSLQENTIKLNLDQTIARKQNIKESYKEYQEESKEIKVQKEELKVEIERIKELLKENNNKRIENEKKIAEGNKSLLESQKVESEIAEQQSLMRVKISTIEQKKDNLLENLRRVKQELEKLYIEKNDLNKEEKLAKEQIREKENQLKDLDHRIQEAKERVTRLEESISTKNKLVEKESLTFKNLFRETEEISHEINELDKDLLRLNNQLEKHTNQLDDQINHMWNTYELTFTSALGLRDPSINNITETKREVSSIKSKMKDLGSINLDAIEEFKAASERYDFLTSQKVDLKKSEENLTGIILELEEGMRRQFDEKFQDIKKEFALVFEELFGGGKATLELTDGDDILEAGIIITAQPPGKKLQNMMQLSGGEKALTAISLLFAIQNLKPSPFCLLDEIEAALDDSNVVRFANYLHKLTANTQFIIITHRRGTMNAADILYGITMQEKGISTLVAVNLIESQLD